MTKMGRLKKGDIFNRIAYELFGVKIQARMRSRSLRRCVRQAGQQAPRAPAEFAPAAPVAEPAKPVPRRGRTYIAPRS